MTRMSGTLETGCGERARTRCRFGAPLGARQLVGGVIDVTEFNPSVAGASGELITTTSDLNRFTSALLAGRILPQPELSVMKTVVAPSTRGLGLEVMPLSCGTAYGHSGDALGASAWTFATGPSRTVTLSVMWGTNRPANAAVSAFLEDALC